VEAEDLDNLKRQPEWVEVATFFKIKLGEIQERVCAYGMDQEELKTLSVKGAVYRELLEWSLKEPGKEKGL